jgi:hypothetical protein
LHLHVSSENFIPISQRIIAIGQLCFAFSLLFWYLFQPFMGEYFALRSRMLLYEYVMGTSDILKSRNKAQLEHQSHRFKQIPIDEQKLLKDDYQQLELLAKRASLKKIEDSLRVLIQNTPPFEQAWIFFSITIAILILLKKEGAKQAAWILPLIALAYAVDNQLTGKPSSFSPDYFLFPTEETIIQHYLDEPLASSPLEQKKQLERGWNRYLMAHWSSNAHENENGQLEESEFNFTLARLKALHFQLPSEWLHPFHKKLGLFSLSLYLLWNGLFAWVVNRPKGVFGLTTEGMAHTIPLT